jgi:hypothetical protein
MIASTTMSAFARPTTARTATASRITFIAKTTTTRSGSTIIGKPNNTTTQSIKYVKGIKKTGTNKPGPSGNELN